MNRNTITQSSMRTSLIALLMLAATIVATAMAFSAGSAQAATKSFGTELNPSVQPSNAGTAHECPGFEGKKCTWVMNDAYGNPGGEESPKAGTLKSIELIAGEAGSFKLQIVKTKNNGASKVVANGPTINYEGQTNPNADDYKVEKFDTNVQIPAGARLAIKTKETSTLRCDSGGDKTLLHQPPLQAGAGFVNPDSDDGCWMLLEAKVK